MGDNITELPKETEIPPLPPKTYQWEDIRRQKLEGRYPWTHLYKVPFDKDRWEESKEHEYEPVIPMNDRKTPPPLVKITVEKSSSSNGATESSEGVGQDKNRLRVPDAENEYDNDSDFNPDSESDPSEEITAEELQQRLEEKYFRCSPATSSGHEYELTETRSVSPATTDDLAAHSTPHSPKMHTRADKIRRKLKNFKDQLSKEYTDCSPRLKRKKAKETQPRKPTPPKKNKFNFRKRGPKAQERTAESSSAGFHMPQAPQWSFPSLSSFSRSRSGSLKERERKRSQSSDTDSKGAKFDFHFGTYPRIFRKGRKHDHKSDKGSLATAKMPPKSVPNSPVSRRSPFPQRWISKLKEPKKADEAKPKDTTERAETSEKIVKESIFISLHDENRQESTQSTSTTPNPSCESVKTEPVPAKMEIDNKNFIFISLHEERFPEKLKQDTNQQLTEVELEIERELKQAQTARKFHNMLRKLETDRKLKARRAAQNDDEPEPVVITEIISDDNEHNGGRCSETIEISVETPQDEDVRKVSGEFVPPERFRVLIKGETIDESTNAADTAPRDQSVPNKVVEEVRIEHEKIEHQREDSTGDEMKSVPQKTPRKKLRKVGSDQESRESLPAFEEAALKDAVILDEQIITKTYIKESLEEIPARVEPIEPEQAAREFREYEEALESSRRYTSFEIESSFSNHNTLARLEAPVPPERPSRKGTLPRMKQRKSAAEVDKENVCECEPNQNYNTFPMAKPDKPRRRFRKRRTYSNSTNNTENAELKNIHELEDDTINKNIVNSKQLSVSFLPLMSDDVREPVVEYNLRETSSMIHLTVPEPPRPPKRRKDHGDDRNNLDYPSLPRGCYSSKTSFSSHEPYTNLELNVETEIEYADDVNSTVPDSDSPPKPPGRKRSAKPSLPDDDRTSREIDSLPSELSAKYDDFGDSDSKDANGYATIEKPASLGDIKSGERNSDSAPRRKSRRFSDFFTLPRIRAPTNYVSPASQTLNYRRLPRPSRPPRRTRSFRQPTTHTNDEHKPPSNEINFEEEEQLNFNLATEDDVDEREDAKNLQTDDILEKMKARPLPPPPRPTRKPKDESKDSPSPHYSQCAKKKIVETNDLSYRTNVEEKIINTTMLHQKTETISKNVAANECSSLGTRFSHSRFDPACDSYLCEQTHERGCVTREYTIECENPEEFMGRSRELRTGFFEQKSEEEASETAKTRWEAGKRNIISETRTVQKEEQISRVPPFEFKKNQNTSAGSGGSCCADKNCTDSRVVPPVNMRNSNVVDSNMSWQLNTTHQDCNTVGEPRTVPKGEHSSRTVPTICERSLNVTSTNLAESEKSSETLQDDKILTKIHARPIEEPFSRTVVMCEEGLKGTNFPKDERTSVTADQIKKPFPNTRPSSEENFKVTNAERNERTFKVKPQQIEEPFSRTFSTSEEHCGMSIRKDDLMPPVKPHENEDQNTVHAGTNEPSEMHRVNVTATAPAIQKPEQISRIVLSNDENLNVINAAKLNVNELNVRKLSIGEIETSKLITSNVESSTMQISHVQSETGNLAINSIEFPERYSTEFISNEQAEPVREIELKDASPSLEDAYSPNARSRISSMIPEVGSDDESNGTVTKVTRPARRKKLPKTDNNISTTPTSSSNAGRATLAELMGQILQICHSSVGQAIHSLLEQFIPEDREKRNEVQAAIWVVTIIVAGCLMLGLQTNEKVVHHHHWDFHFPPPH